MNRMHQHRLAAITLVLLAVVTTAMLLSLTGSSAAYQGGPAASPTLPAPTLIPPTSLPALAPTPFQPPTESALATIQQSHVLRVGTLYNAYPFVWLDERGNVSGYEADILRAIAIELGIEVDFVQVTRHNADDLLLSQHVDLLIGQQVHTRDRETLLDFTAPYYVNAERMVVRTDAAYMTLQDLAGHPIAVEIGSRSEHALRTWNASTGTAFDIRTYFTESDALDALANGEVEGMLGELDSLGRAGRQQMRLIDAPVLDEYYAIALRRWDVNLRNLLTRSLQRLKASGRLDQIFDAWFPGESIDFTTLVPVYDLLSADTRGVDDFPTDIPMPAAPVGQRIQNGQSLRVAGVMLPGEEAPAQVRITNTFNQALLEEMTRRWGVALEYIPNSTSNAAGMVASGMADLAAGVSPRWDGADMVDYAQPYLRHGDRLMVPVASSITTGFGDMLGTGWTIGYIADTPSNADDIKKYAGLLGVGQNIREPFAIQREQDAIYVMTVQNNVSAIFGDNLRLAALQREENATDVKILPLPYGDDIPLTFAVPRNDADFRSLVTETLQDMAKDGTFQQLWNTYFGMGDPPPIPYWAPTSPDAAPQG